MDLSTQYLGFKLPHPLMAGASPLADDLTTVRRLEDAGASMIVLSSLFEEQIRLESLATSAAMDGPKDQSPEASSYLPEPDFFTVGPEEYLERVRKTKAAVKVPVIASLNGTTPGGWLEYAKLIEQAGADGLEINLYYVASDAERSGQAIEDEHVAIVRELKKTVRVPLAVKLSPFYSSLPHFVRRLGDAGADAVVLFNRFYQPDIDVENLDLQRSLHLSNSAELLMRLRWAAILFGNYRGKLAITGGVHTAVDAVKAVMAGASAVQMVSALFKHGPAHLGRTRAELARWLEDHEYESLGQMLGSMSLQRAPSPDAYSRANYMHLIQNWQSTLQG